MKSGVPWQVEGVRQHARETAQEAARRAGMSIGEWLDAIILDTALHDGVDPRRCVRPQRPAVIGAACLGAVNTLRNDLAEIGLTLQEAMPRKAVEALEGEVRKLADRIDHIRNAGADAASLNGIERGLAEARDALRALTPAENLVGADHAVQKLSNKLDLLASSAQDPGILRQLGAAIIAMRGMVSHVASNDALANLSDEVRALARKVDQAVPSGGSSFALEERIAMLADALEAHNQRRQNTPHDLEGVVKGLMEKIDRLQLALPNHAGIRHLEERIGQLVAKLEVSGARLNHLEAIEHGLTELLAHLENQRMPHSASRARAASQLPELPVAAAEPVEIAQSLRAAASPARERRPIEPDSAARSSSRTGLRRGTRR